MLEKAIKAHPLLMFLTQRGKVDHINTSSQHIYTTNSFSKKKSLSSETVFA